MKYKENFIGVDDILIQSIYFSLTKNCKKYISKKVLDVLNNSRKSKNRKKVIQILYALNKFKFLRGDRLKILLNISKISSDKIIKDILLIRRGSCGYNKPLKIKLPIKANPKLSLLVAKTLGDGCICSDYRFIYDNKERILIDEVIKAVEDSIGITDYKIYLRKSQCYEIKFPSIIGYILHLLGSPKGLKVKNNFDIPEWIRKGDKNIKSSFLKGLFDDEACVDFRGTSRRIILAMGKIEKHEKSLIKFFEEIKNMLNEFQIESKDIHFQEKTSNSVILRFSIYREDNFRKFEKFIGFSHPKKRDILSSILGSFIDKQKTKKSVLKIVNDSKRPLNTREIADMCNIDTDLAYYHLYNLARECKINKMSIANPMFWSNMGEDLITKEERILKVISHKPLSTREISKKSGVNYKYAIHLLHKLNEQGLVNGYKNPNFYVWLKNK